MIIQCGGTVIGGLVLSYGSESLRCVAPASMYVIPGMMFVGFGLWALKSACHCMEAASMHIAGSPIAFGWPGIHVKPFIPSRKTTVFPFESISTMRADFATSGGPADIARAILACTESESAAEEAATKIPTKQSRSLIFPLFVPSPRRVHATVDEIYCKQDSGISYATSLISAAIALSTSRTNAAFRMRRSMRLRISPCDSNAVHLDVSPSADGNHSYEAALMA